MASTAKAYVANLIFLIEARVPLKHMRNTADYLSFRSKIHTIFLERYRRNCVGENTETRMRQHKQEGAVGLTTPVHRKAVIDKYFAREGDESQGWPPEALCSAL